MRNQRNQMLKENRAIIGKLSARLTLVPVAEINAAFIATNFPMEKRPVMAWRSRNYFVQLYEAPTAEHPLMLRLSICRTKIKPDGNWEDGLTWDELNTIKIELGYGNWWGVEVFPRTDDIVNTHNFRHLWLLPEPLGIGF